MADEQVIKLLEEIRDSQKAYLELYKQAVRNQDESLEMQRAARKRAKIILPMFAIFLMLLLAQLWFPHLLR